MSTESAVEIQEPDYKGIHTDTNYLKEQICLRTGFNAHDFQLHAVVSLLAGNDVVVHAGTGSGKTLIFAAPHFIQEKRTSVLISPLILLQQDQRMRKIGVTAIAVNKEVHLEPKDWDDIRDGKYQILLLSPEMALHSEQVHKVFDNKLFRNALIAMFVDEVHTISLWGGDFRKDYRGLGRIRARLPRGIPVSVVSATLRPKVKQDVLSTLGFPADPSKYIDINIGNERRNVFVGVKRMKFPSSSFRDLSILLPSNATTPLEIPKAIVYIDDVVDVTLAGITLNSWLHPSLQELGLIVPVHAWMPPSYRSDAMARLFSGLGRIIICTEAAGMGCDIPDIIRVVQFRICKSVDAFIQRIGRAVRNPEMSGDGWLIAEPWAWKGTGGSIEERSRKASDPVLLGLVSEGECRRKYLNKVYKNPLNDNPVPSSECCDLCDAEVEKRLVYHTFNARNSAPTTRAAAVSGDSNPTALECLKRWRRSEFMRKFGETRMFGAAALISDEDLVRVSRCTPIPSIQQLYRYLVKWSYVDTLLEPMWRALQDEGFAPPDIVEDVADTTAPDTRSILEPQAVPKPSQTQKSNSLPQTLSISASKLSRNPSRSTRSVTAPSVTSQGSLNSSHPPPTPIFPPPKRRYIESTGTDDRDIRLPQSQALLRIFMAGAQTRQLPSTKDNHFVLGPSSTGSNSQQLERIYTSSNILQPSPTHSRHIYGFLDQSTVCIKTDQMGWKFILENLY